MPTSAPESIPYWIEFVRKNKPHISSVLDVGMGFGADGFLLREFFDVKEHQAHNPSDWKLQITGVDIYDGYLSELQKMVYNKIIIGDILEVLPKLGKFELAILNDVIEHTPKEKGKQILHNLFDHVEDIVIVTPNGFKEHAASEENEHEEHLSGWAMDDFKSFTILDSAVVKRLNKPEELLVIYLRK